MATVDGNLAMMSGHVKWATRKGGASYQTSADRDVPLFYLSGLRINQDLTTLATTVHGGVTDLPILRWVAVRRGRRGRIQAQSQREQLVVTEAKGGHLDFVLTRFSLSPHQRKSAHRLSR